MIPLSRRRFARFAALASSGLAAQNRMNTRIFSFAGGKTGQWSVLSAKAVIGEPLALTERLDVQSALISPAPAGAAWVLRGVTSNERYVTRAEKDQLAAKQTPPGRAEATRAALIPIRKNAAWWAMTQDERRKILEETSHHIRTGLAYLPAISRRLHHCRDLESAEPFDFLTWFDYAPTHSEAFEELVSKLRATEEWRVVDREVDIRLTLRHTPDP